MILECEAREPRTLSRRFYTRSRPFVRIWSVARNRKKIRLFCSLGPLVLGQYYIYLFAGNHRYKAIFCPRSNPRSHPVDLIRRSWVRFPPRSKDFFFTSCGSLIPFTRANAQWVIHGLHVRVNSLFHHLPCS